MSRFNLQPWPELDGQAPSSITVAKFWIAAYSEMLEMGKRAIQAATASMSPAARREVEAIDLPLLEILCDQHRERLAYWSQRLLEIEEETS